MFEIGSSLREARIRRGVELAQAETATRIRAKYLNALEEEQFESLPGDAYARAFLRGYAKFLGLDPELFVDEYNARFPVVEEPGLSRPRPRRALPVVALVSVLAVGVLSLVAWHYGTQTNPRPAGPIEPVGVSVTRAEIPATTAPTLRANVKAQAPKAKPTSVAVVLAAARGDCWLSARLGSRAGPTLYEGLLRQGETVRLRGKQLWVRLGAPWNLDARLNGKPVHELPPTTGNVLITRAGLQSA